MALNVKLVKHTFINAKVNNTDGVLTPAAPITLKNQIQEQLITSITSIPDVTVVDASSGATLVYNTTTQIYEVKQLDIDGGTF